MNKFQKINKGLIVPVCLTALALGVLLPVQAAATEITAKVVAMDQVIVYNRLGAINPAGMIFALARDVFPLNTGLDDQTYDNSCAEKPCTAGQVRLRDDKRPRPLTLRVNEGDTLVIVFTNLLNPIPVTDAANEPMDVGIPNIQSEQPATRHAGFHVHGMQLANSISDDGSKVGGGDSLAAPGQTKTYRLVAEKEGAYVVTSGPNLGGEGGSGAIANGLFGVVNVEPLGSEWYRSQLTRQEMEWATKKNLDGTPMTTNGGHPLIDYDAVYPSNHPYAGRPILKVLNGNVIFHSDLNAIITGPGRGNFTGIPNNPTYPNRNRSFREFTVAFHDEIKVVQAFDDWYTNLKFTLSSVKDGFAINYGTGGIGSEIIANRLGYGPMKDCTECKYEEFFLTSWAVGDPAMIVDVPATMARDLADQDVKNADGSPVQATRAFYPDDPSNVWHGYLNDRTKIRNIHVGTEHHIFHLHTHQWLFTPDDDNSSYLDSQAIGPGSSFTYEIAYGGGGNRNKTLGDAIFHCHFYPHFAQGMWGLWRVHDSFEPGSVIAADGTVAGRGLPDGEIAGGGYDGATAIAGGTPIPSVVPIPGIAMAPMPGTTVKALVDTNNDDIPDSVTATSEAVAFQGYPFYIPGEAGHRPPSPPLDIAATGGIPRHVITGGTVDQVQTPTDFTKALVTAVGRELPEEGTPAERAAMAFHGSDRFHASYKPDGSSAGFEVNGLPPKPGAPYADPCRTDAATPIGVNRTYRASVIQLDDFIMNKVGWHFNQERIIVLDSDVEATMSGERAPEPFVMRANSEDCVEFYHTNRVPHIYEGDDFQVTTPTDIIGQHIHLVKFDVTSSDGSANGWNYEDGTFSPDEITERIHALKAAGGSWTGSTLAANGSPRTTIQRWYVDPVKNNADVDRTLGNVFTHDHFGPSTHQQVGLYATLLTEPKGSTWRDPSTGVALGGGAGGEVTATSWRADILAGQNSYREFYLEFADFQLAYWGAGGAAMQPVNPSDRKEIGLPDILETNLNPLCGGRPCPEAISAADPGTFVVNYRNEPLALRVLDMATLGPDPLQAEGPIGDLAHAFSSTVPGRQSDVPADWPYAGATASIGARPGDPYTPILNVYPGDKVSIRVQVGAHEEGHNFSINGIKWRQQYASPSSGFVNSQMMGISEYFRFEVPGLGKVRSNFGVDDYIYRVGSSVDALWNGAWGIMRAHEDQQPFLKDLPNNPKPWLTFKGKPPKEAQPPADQIQHYTIVAVAAEDVLPQGTLVYNPDTTKGGPLNDPTALMYVLAGDLEPVTPGDPLCERPVGKGKNPKTVVDVTLATCRVRLKDSAPIEPLILRAPAGKFIDVDLYNKVLLQAVDANGALVFDSTGNPVFEDPGSEASLFVDRAGTIPAFPSLTFDTIPDLEGFNSLPMIVEHFNANDIRPSAHVGLHAQLVGYDVGASDGMNVGYNPVQTAAPGGKVSYRWYAGDIRYNLDGTKTYTPIEFGAVNLMPADPIKHSNKGLVGALVIEPQGATWTEDPGTRASATVTYSDGPFRDFVLMLQDDVNMRFGDGSFVPTVSEEEESEDSGMKAVNYRTDPIWYRLGIGATADAGITRTKDFTNAFAGDPVTPVFTATAGEKVRFRVLKPGGHNRNHVFTLHGHLWARHPFKLGTSGMPQYLSETNPDTFYHGEQMGIGPTSHFNVLPLTGAGGKNSVPGDYLYRDMVPVHVYNGIWGIFRVTP